MFFLQLSGDFPLNHNKQKCKMFPNDNQSVPSQHGSALQAFQCALPELPGGGFPLKRDTPFMKLGLIC